MDHVLELVTTFGRGAFPFSAEFMNVGMALQGAMMVRGGPNKDRKLHWFHAFCLSVLGGFGGGIIGFMWLGLPSGFFVNDLAMGSCMLAYVIVNCLPGDVGYKFCSFLPVKMIITVGAQLFRSKGVVGFTNTCFNLIKDKPSAYYPTPIFGPIMYATLLGNWGAFVLKGFNGHVANGMPWPVQNGIFCASFYHFYANDAKGFIGQILRTSFPLVQVIGFTDDESFAMAVVTIFMQIMGQLQLPDMLGPSFTPFGTRLLSPFYDASTWYYGPKETAYSQAQEEKKRRKRSKKKKKKSNGNSSVAQDVKQKVT